MTRPRRLAGGAGGDPRAVHAPGAAAPPPPPARRPRGWAVFRGASLSGCSVWSGAPVAALRPPCDVAPPRGVTRAASPWCLPSKRLGPPRRPSMRPQAACRRLPGAALSPAGLLLLLLLPAPPLPLGCLWAAGTPARAAPGALQDSSLSAGRVKRGWVWNQFFVVEEYTGTEPLYVGKVKRDPAPTFLNPGPRTHSLVDARDSNSLTHPTPCSISASAWSPLPQTPGALTGLSAGPTPFSKSASR